jgi:hypothetical protein
MGDDEDLMELCVEQGLELLRDQPSALFVLAAEDLVEDCEPRLDASLVGGHAREPQAYAEAGEILLAAGEPLERVGGATIEDLDRVLLRDAYGAVAALGDGS